MQYVCVFALAGVRDDPWGEQIDGIMHVLNIITMQNWDGILGGIQTLMGLSNGSSLWDWTQANAHTIHTQTQIHTFYATLTSSNDLDKWSWEHCGNTGVSLSSYSRSVFLFNISCQNTFTTAMSTCVQV